jgi:hypothetical protein
MMSLMQRSPFKQNSVAASDPIMPSMIGYARKLRLQLVQEMMVTSKFCAHLFATLWTSNLCSSVRIYKVSTRVPKGPPLLAPWSMVLQTQPHELLDLGLLREVKICGDVVTVLFARFPDKGMEGETRILCFNSSTHIRAVITGLDLASLSSLLHRQMLTPTVSFIVLRCICSYPSILHSSGPINVQN